MRIIAGKFRSRRLRSLRGIDIRPTSDRLRETLFNVLTAGSAEALAGSVWLDLFAGTGAVGIEALSRGASVVYFVEHSKRAVGLIRNNLDSLQIQSDFRILQQETQHAILELEREGVQANFIFLDPPYRLQSEYARTLEALAHSNLGLKAVIIAEHERRFDPGGSFGNLKRSRRLEQGDAALSFYRFQPLNRKVREEEGTLTSTTQ